jgi:hypothetical protein
MKAAQKAEWRRLEAEPPTEDNFQKRFVRDLEHQSCKNGAAQFHAYKYLEELVLSSALDQLPLCLKHTKKAHLDVKNLVHLATKDDRYDPKILSDAKCEQFSSDEAAYWARRLYWFNLELRKHITLRELTIKRCGVCGHIIQNTKEERISNV